MLAVQPLHLANLPSGNFYSSYNGVPIFYRRYFDILCILKCGQFRICELILPLFSILIFPFSLFIYNASCAKYTIFSVLYNIKHKSYLQPLKLEKINYFTKMMWNFSGGGIVKFLLSFIFTLLIFLSALSAHCAMHNFTLMSFSSVSLTLTDIGGAGRGCIQFLATH